MDKPTLYIKLINLVQDDKIDHIKLMLKMNLINLDAVYWAVHFIGGGSEKMKIELAKMKIRVGNE